MKPKHCLILDLCGGTGSWSRPYREAGYPVEVITLDRGYDILEWLPPDRAHGVLAAPPCTEFAVSGARWWASKPPSRLRHALAIVDACLRIIRHTRPRFWALENPIGRLKRLCPSLGEPRLVFDPCDYGDAWRKRTILWGKFHLPEPSPVTPVAKSPIHHAPPGPYRQLQRSITPPKFARAFFEANP